MSIINKLVCCAATVTCCLVFVSTANAASNIKPIALTHSEADILGEKVWQNEGAGKLEYLLHWNDGEDFMSLGIGHFIWFAKGHTEIFDEAFPKVLRFYEANEVAMPAWLSSATPCPWRSKVDFFSAKSAKTDRYVELENFINSTKSVQARFMVQRLDQALPKILEELDSDEEKALVRDNFNKVLYQGQGQIDPHGLYVLLDYLNFKGEGIVEQYKGEGWGLLPVLQHMDIENKAPVNAFADSARKMLTRRIENSPPERNEIRWKSGWFIRLRSYDQ